MPALFYSAQMRFILTVFILSVLALGFLSFKDEEDPLHKRTFTIGLSETKNGVIAKKVIMDKIEFKNGKLRTDFLQKKFGYSWIRYHINKDSIYTDSTGMEVRRLDVEAIATDESNQTVYLNFVSCEWDLDGTIRLTKNDRLKRYYDVAGREKGGKPKKEKKNEKEVPVFSIVQ